LRENPRGRCKQTVKLGLKDQLNNANREGHTVLLLAEIVKLLAEIALLCLVGQWVLALLAGRKREQNLFYQLFQVLTKPLLVGARWVAPRVVLDRHLPLVAFLLLSFVWIVATITKIDICVRIGVHLCR
jgi:hypothetical protein